MVGRTVVGFCFPAYEHARRLAVVVSRYGHDPLAGSRLGPYEVQSAIDASGPHTVRSQLERRERRQGHAVAKLWRTR
jgi:hypothetical protein